MRRRLAILPIALLAGVLIVRRLRARAARTPLAPSPPQPPLAPAEPVARFVSVPWTLVAAPADDACVTLRYRADEHMELDRVDAQETPTQVFVTVLMSWQPPAGGWFALVREHEATITLSGPLGGRELVHAPVDEVLADAESAGGRPDAPPLYP